MLLDGEMIIDTNENTQKQERRYLIHDMMAIIKKIVSRVLF
jgi:mRNA-capping enzyme